MKFVETPIEGLYVIEIEPRTDERGMFARTYCDEEFAARGLHTHWPQMNVSFNEKVGTLRGLHYQRVPHEEPKVVRCAKGRVFDVAVDLREGSPTRLRWFGVELDDEKRNALYIPVGFAHGFQTLTPRCEVGYQMGTPYAPGSAAGFRWNDPAVGVVWPILDVTLSERDASLPLVNADEYG